MGVNGEHEHEFKRTGAALVPLAREVGSALLEAEQDAIILVEDQSGRIYRIAAMSSRKHMPTSKQVIILDAELFADRLQDITIVGGGRN